MTERTDHEEVIAERANEVIDQVANSVLSHIQSLELQLAALKSTFTESMASTKKSIRDHIHVGAGVLESVHNVTKQVTAMKEQLQINGNGKHAEPPPPPPPPPPTPRMLDDQDLATVKAKLRARE